MYIPTVMKSVYVSVMTVAVANLVACSAANNTTVVPPQSNCSIDAQTQLLRLNSSDYDEYTYVNLLSGEVLNLTDEEAANSLQWHLAMRRNNVLLNGGLSGPGNTVAAIANNQDGFYNENGEPNHGVFLSTGCDEQADILTASYDAASLEFKPDDFVSAVTLPEAEEDEDGYLDYGWYKQDKDQASNRKVNTYWTWLIRSGEGNSYAKFSATNLSYNALQGLTVSFDFEVQAANSKGFNSDATFSLNNAGTGLYCFDFDTDQNVACSGTHWDLQLEVDGLNWALKSNSGVSGEGAGGVFGRFDPQFAAVFTEGEKDYLGNNITGHYFADKFAGTFDGAWYAYNLQGQHKLFPNYRVFMIDPNPNDASVPYIKLQVLTYYDDNGISGYPLIRFKASTK